MTSDEVEIVRSSAKAFSKIAENMLANQKTETANALNKGRHKSKYKLNDLVTFFKPPTQKEVKRRRRKAKHCFYHHGPAKLVKALSDTAFVLEYRGRKYRRSIRNMRKYRGKTTDQNILPPDADIKVKAGNLVAVKDSDAPDDKLFHIAKVESISDEHLKVRYYGTNKQNPAQVKFKPMWIDPKDNKLRVRRPVTHPLEAKRYQYTGTIDLDEGELPSLVLLSKVVLQRGVMEQKYWDKLIEAGYKHHVAGSTYH
jgi:hypothetical protein